MTWNWRDDPFHSINPPEEGLTGPVYTSIAYAFTSAREAAEVFEGKPGYAYPRIACGTPPVYQLAQRIKELELKGEDGDVLLTASGMSATAMLILALADKGRSIVSSPYLYGGTYNLFDEFLPRLGIECVMIDDPLSSDSWEEGILKAKNPVCLFAEDDANPMLIKLDNKKIAALAHKHNLLYVCDRTIGTPILEKPLLQINPDERTDIVIHSLSKNISGYSWALGGAIVGKKEIIKEIREGYFCVFGPVMDSRVADRILYGMGNLEERMAAKQKNAAVVAEFLENHPKVSKIYGPGGDLLSFEIYGSLEKARQMVESFQFIIFAPHLGDVKTLAIHPASTTHARVPVQQRLKMGISDTLIRISVGVEDVDEVILDLEQALVEV